MSEEEELLIAVGDPVVITDPAGAIQFVNAAFSRQNGYDVAEVLGKTPNILQSGQTDPAVYPALWQALTAGRTFSGTVVNRRKDGSTYEAVLTITPVRDASGTVTQYVSTHHDITELKQTEAALRRSEADLRGLIERAVFGIYRCTPDGRLLMVNQALVEMLGYDSAAEVLAVSTMATLYQHPEERSRLLERYAAHEVFTGVEVGWKRKDDTHRSRCACRASRSVARAGNR